jgi:hypothetical protein
VTIPEAAKIKLDFLKMSRATIETCKKSHYKPFPCNPITGLDRPCGFQEVEAPRLQDNRHMKVVRVSALCTGRLYPQEIFLVLISVRGARNI